MNWFFYSLLSICLGALGAWIVIKLGGSYGLMDLPGYRSSHRRPTPKGGGVGIVCAAVFVSLFNTLPITLWGPAIIISAIGFVDDRVELSKSKRLLIQVGCALVVLLGASPTFGPTAFPPLLSIVIGTLFIVGTANFFNFMDGINGIAGISASVGFGLLAIYGMLQGAPAPFILLDLCMVAACIGFLPFNLPRARVFMGDTGSVFLGFLFATIAWRSNATLLGVVTCAAFFFLIYADAATTFGIRIVEGDQILVAHRRHLYQVLVNELGLSHWKVSLGYGIAQVLIGVVVIALQNISMTALVAGLTAMGLLFVVVSVILHRKADRMEASTSS
jgi:Fuc2NAc and GlcNAc transferase